MTTPPTHDASQGELALQALLDTRNQRANEAVTRQTVISALNDMYPSASRPWWVRRHIRGAEQIAHWMEEGTQRRGFVDSVVGATAIEYESDLRDPRKFATGIHQVKQYCAALLNDAVAEDSVRGVLSDGVEWHAYGITVQSPTGSTTDVDTDDITLTEIETLVIDGCGTGQADQWASFMSRHLGRDGCVPLSGATLAEFLGFGSAMGRQHLNVCQTSLMQARDAMASHSEFIHSMWDRYTEYLRVDDVSDEDSDALYSQEFYLSLVARLVCANVIEQQPLHSDQTQLDEILTGQFFEAKGLTRLVEHDYFGWLVQEPAIAFIRSLAEGIQADLNSFDFNNIADPDVFGTLMSSMAVAHQRTLLGQEWTPAWLADRMAEAACEMLPDGEWPRFVDPTCGSGALIVATNRLVHQRLMAANIAPGSQEALQRITASATGFDVDPLAVILAKVNWVVANRNWLPLNGQSPTSIPIYNADSLFALSPIFDSPSTQTTSTGHYELFLQGNSVALPDFLVAPDRQILFDEIVERAYSLATTHAHCAPDDRGDIPTDSIDIILTEAAIETGTDVTSLDTTETKKFLLSFANTLAELERDGKNGIWAFILRNSLRPGLVAAQFNGLVSNPPWLAMSKLSHNPFAAVLTTLAERFSLNPSGSSFLHLEMATVFLAYAAHHYLAPDAGIVCILPDTVKQGSQHQPLRDQLSGHTPTVVTMTVQKVWTVDRETFRNKAIVLLGSRTRKRVQGTFPGEHVTPTGSTTLTFYNSEFAGRRVWTNNNPDQATSHPYPTGFASQGADIMPRRLWAVHVVSRQATSITVKTPDSHTPEDRYLISDDKKHKNFAIGARTVPIRYAHSFWVSKHLAPFVLAEPATAILPIEYKNNDWSQLSDTSIATSKVASRHFQQVIATSDFQDLRDAWNRGLNMRNKLTNQTFGTTGFLVLYGAGGGIPAAAYANLATYGTTPPPIIDQTLYWMHVTTEDEAQYLTGMINSGILRELLKGLIPQGAFGDRHLHTLPSKAIPKFDPTDTTHQSVVAATRCVISDLQPALTGQDTKHLFSPNRGLAQRRSAVRGLIENLPSNHAYEEACLEAYTN